VKFNPNLEAYIKSISIKFSRKETSEMGYRSDFEVLIKNILEPIINNLKIDHDAKAQEGNKPDFILSEGDLPILYIETKNIGVSLDKSEKSKQLNRYYNYTNLILTDYIEFRFYRNGYQYNKPIKIAHYDIKNRTLLPIAENFKDVIDTIINMAKSYKEPIRSSKRLAEIMGGKAKRIRDEIKSYVFEETKKNENILKLYKIIKDQLVSNLTIDSFADMYAQTIVYGLFIAKFNNDIKNSFNRQIARDLIPESNSLLRHFFDHITGADFDKRLEYIVNELCDLFSCTDIKKIMMEDYSKDDFDCDPIIHFYENFLQEYDINIKKKFGAFYTPSPIVNFIVKSVDYLLQNEFDIKLGIASTLKLENGDHRVQILDPSVGTGTFLDKVISIIHEKLCKSSQGGRWTKYVNDNVLPRIHGFEIMMTPYIIAHLKLRMTLYQTKCETIDNKINIYLTNSLDEKVLQKELFSDFGFLGSIAMESKEAAVIKNEKPIMVVIGNPPYSVSSSNKGKWIQNLIKDYKKDLGERKINLDDDYIKFIRFAEHFIEKNNGGIVAMITNNSFIDGITHRQMRKHLLDTFDDIYIFDLHGSSKKKEKAPDGGKDENVFDIQQGVSISIFIRRVGEKKGLAIVHHTELYGKRADKFHMLNESDIQTVKWKNLDYSEPYYFFVPKDFGLEEEYGKGFKIDELFRVSNSGVKTDRDTLFIDMDKSVLEKRIQKLLSEDYDENFKQEFRVFNSGSYKLTEKVKGKSFDENYVQPVQYRPFDYQWIYYDPSLVSRPANKVMSHIVGKENMAIVTARQFGGGSHFICLITKTVSEISSQPYAPYTLFPIYLYSKDGSCVPNIKKEIVDEIENIVGKVSPENIFDYIYAVLHSPSYREKYKEFLKIDFPRVSYPKDAESFKELIAFGAELRSLHLLESPKVNQFITTYPIEGSDTIEKLAYKDGNVFINKDQYFGNVPEIAWNFYIGGYQPAQKWLKDRKERVLNNEDIEHYQKIIVALTETDRIMKKIDQAFICP